MPGNNTINNAKEQTNVRTESLKKSLKSNKIGKDSLTMARWKVILLMIVLLGIVVEISLYSFLLYYGRKVEPVKADTIIVLGCRVEGTVPGPQLVYRLEKALLLYNEEFSERIIVTGGQGPDEGVSEAQAMRDFLLAKGIPADRIIMEDKSRSTTENIAFSKVIMDRHGYKSALLVTSDYHAYRGIQMAKDAGILASAGPVHLPWYYLYNRFRETLAVMYYWVFLT